MFAGTALSVRLLVYAGLSLFIINGPYVYMVVCVVYAYNLTERRNYMVELLVGETEEIIHKLIVVVWWSPILSHLHLYTLLYTKQIWNQNDGQDVKEKICIAIAFICHIVWKPGNCREEISMYYAMTFKRWKRLRVVGISGPDICKGWGVSTRQE